MKHCRKLLILLVTGFLPLHALAQYDGIESRLKAVMDEHSAVGLSVVAVKDGRVVYQNAMGLKDIEYEAPLNGGDIFRIASISKSFSSTAIMRLVEQKRISLDDDFSKLVGFDVRNPRYPDKVITLRMVLSHTSSINDSQGYFTLDVINPATNPDWEKCYSAYAPGEGYRYCNLNFNMVGAVIERLTGERFDVHIRNQILRPLGLEGGYCVDSLDRERFVTLYAYDSGVFEPSPAAYASRQEAMIDYTMGYSAPIFSPTGGMKISAPDLARYMRMHMNSGTLDGVEIISKKSARTMRKPVAKEEGYALALLQTDKLIPGETLTDHTGSAYGLYSAMFFHPKKKYGFVAITNGCKPNYTDGFISVLRDAINVLYEDIVQE